MSDIRLRPPHAEDAEALARIWVENARYYTDIDSSAFQVPDEDGLVD